LIRVVLVDDSQSVRAVLRRFFAKTPDIQVVGEAEDGAQALRAVLDFQPQVVVMDLQMPVMDGYSAIEQIMAVRPTPIVVLSSRANRNQMQTAFEAMRRGALEVLPKPEDTPSWQQLAENLPETVRAIAEARAQPRPAKRPRAAAPAAVSTTPPSPSLPQELRWVAIGASTGGPAAIRELMDEVPADAPVGFAVVQHIASGFELGMARISRADKIMVDGWRALNTRQSMSPRTLAIDSSALLPMSRSAPSTARPSAPAWASDGRFRAIHRPQMAKIRLDVLPKRVALPSLVR